MKATPVLLAAGFAFLAGCASPNGPLYQPVIDPQSVTDYGKYHVDLGECNQLAQASRASGPGMMEGLLGGLLVGAAFGAIADDTGLGARYGALSGFLAGTGEEVMTEKQVAFNCMRGRGYTVLN
jgi:predicted lipid-binding transport protein (Tim44 family)